MSRPRAGRLRFAVVLVVVAIVSSVEAKEKAIPRSEVPAAVLKAVTARYPRARMTRFTREVDAGSTVYEVRLDDGGTRIDVISSPAGKLIQEEVTITWQAAPDAVRKGLAASRYARAQVRRVEKVVHFDRPERPDYELLVAQAGAKYELVFDSAGALTKSEQVSGAD